MRIWTIVLAAVLLVGCGTPATRLELAKTATPIPPGDPGYERVLQVRYLGAGGLLLQRGDDVVVMAPFMSNPSMPRVAFAEVSTKRGRVDHWLESIAPSLARTQAILAGHSHYDHLMDLPYITSRYAPQATVYGNDTMVNLLAPANVKRMSIEGVAGDSTTPGKWQNVSQRVRFMPLRSEHAAIFDHFFWAEGEVEEPLAALPTRASAWKQGRALAYLIDFMSADGERVAFRLHYQDAASTPPYGFPPAISGHDEHPVDVAFLCVPGYNLVDHYPDGVAAYLRPRTVVGIHWESFFRELPDDVDHLWTLPMLDVPGFEALLKTGLPGVTFMLPAPGAWLLFEPVPGT
jgi:L-ascorbate metabolism protein UlaG (beta-lactamase superfamily)